MVSDIRKDLSQEGKNKEEDDESPAVLKLIDIIIKSAIYIGASDIHIEATEKSCIIRERVDGMLRQSFTFDKDIFNVLLLLSLLSFPACNKDTPTVSNETQQTLPETPFLLYPTELIDETK